jgi:di/tripeptidase
MQLGANILAISPPANPRTTYNIGMIEGGQSINSLASQAALWLDLRSESSDSLAALERQVRSLADSFNDDSLTCEIKVVGDRPGGTLPSDHPLVQGALLALAQVGMRGVLETGSTDCNIPLAAGCPAVTVGITHGGNAHRLDEYIEVSPVKTGMRQLLILVLAAAEGYD